MPRTNPITDPMPRLYVKGVEVRPTSYVTMDNGVVLVEVTTADEEPTLRGQCSKPPYWLNTNSIQVEKSEITAIYD